MAQGWRGQYYRYKDFFLNILELYRKKKDLRMFLEVILSVSTIIVFLIFALKPTVITIINLVKEINEKEATVIKLDQKIRNLATAKNVYNAETPSIEILRSSVPNSPSPAVFTGQMQAIANKNGVEVLGISVGEVVLVGSIPAKKTASSKDLAPLPSPSKEMSSSISVKGSYLGLANFIRDIQDARRPLRIDILGLTATNTDEGQTISLIISGRVPYLGQ